MDRFLIDDILENNIGKITNKDEIKHITKVLRMKENEEIEGFTKDFREFVCKINKLNKDYIELSILEELFKNRELKTKITIYQGIPKGQKMELIVQKATELGVTRIVPCDFKRCISNIGEKEDKKIARWQKIAQEAAKQSKRLAVPLIDTTLKISNLVEDMNKNDLNILFYEADEDKTLKKLIKEVRDQNITSIGIIIGSEGGFEAKECELLESNGAKIVNLGDRILRTETAAIYGASILAYEFE